jgi:hypothetical protein
VRRGLQAALALCVLCVAMVAAPAHAANRASVSVSLTTRKPATAAGSTQENHIREPGKPGAKPHAVTTIVFRLAPGTVIDTNALPQCKASDADLLAQGPAACPANSRVNTGVVRSDTGSTGAFPRIVHSDIQSFNNQGEIIGVATAREIPFRNVTRSRIQGSTITFDVPQTPGQGEPDPMSSALTDLSLVTPVLGTERRPYERTPPSCPTDGFWTGSVLFIYRDGKRETVPLKSPCDRASRDRHPPHIRLLGVPRWHCARHAFRARVRVRDRSGVRRIAMYLDGRLIRDTRRTRFTRKIGARSGRHRLTVLARDGAGNRARKSLRFRRCAA